MVLNKISWAAARYHIYSFFQINFFFTQTSVLQVIFSLKAWLIKSKNFEKWYVSYEKEYKPNIYRSVTEQKMKFSIKVTRVVNLKLVFTD